MMSPFGNIRDLLRAGSIAAGMALILTLASGCAYYNMLYNAKAMFAEAEKMPLGSEGEVTQPQITAYDAVADKARAMIEKYPDSRHVDDAYLLIARSRLAQEKYQMVVETIDELELRLPESELMEEATFLKGFAYARLDRNQEALDILESFMAAHPKSDHLPHALYLAGRSAILLGNDEKAIAYMDRLRGKYSDSPYRLEADLEAARIHMERERPEAAIAVLEKLSAEHLARKDRYRVWVSLARAYMMAGRYKDALRVLAPVGDLEITDTERAEAMLLTAQAYVGTDSVSVAIGEYKNVAARFVKSKFSAEAHFRLGDLYQNKLDSLEVAKTHYEAVSGQFPGSEFSTQAIKNSSNISQLIRLRESAGEDTPEARAARQFSLAEIELFQLEKPEQALASYRKLVEEYPQSEYAPRAAYAIAYIYADELGDSTSAREAFLYLIEHYPESQQAAYAEQFRLSTGDREALERRRAVPAPPAPAPEANPQ
jgi:TolA-binding protein